MKLTLDMKGAAELRAALLALADDREIRKAARQALRAAARPIQATAVELAPEYQGFLKQAIKIKPGKRNSVDFLTMDIGIDQDVDPPRMVARKKRKGLYRDPGVAGHAMMIEFGTPQAPAQPFLTPAWDKHSEQTPERINHALGPAIDRAAARIARKAAKAK